MWQMEIAIIFVATSFSVLTFVKNNTPIIGIISSIFWFYTAISSNKIIVYCGDTCSSIINMDFYHLTYLFSGLGLIFIVYSIYLYVGGAQKTIGKMYNEGEGEINKNY